MTQKELANRMGRPLKTINEIVKGKAAITAETALQLERVLGVPASFWINLEKNYREALARKRDEERLSGQLAWLKQFPVGAMVRAGWIQGKEKVGQLREALRFFGVASPDQWHALWAEPGVSYRKSRVFTSDPGAVTAWLRRGEVEAQGVQCRPYDSSRLRSTLEQMRALTTKPPEVFQPTSVRLCAESGVALVFVRELPKLRISGATRWLSPTKAMIQLSLRHKTDDHLWFSFFHEVGHILLHGKRAVFIDHDGAPRDAREAEADTFAADILIPRSDFAQIRAMSSLGEADVRRFAQQIGVSPGIVVGRLQHEGLLPYNRLNALKQQLEWAMPKARTAA